MVDAKRRVFEREHNGRAWLAFHIAHLPNQKRPKPLSDLLIGRAAEEGPKGLQTPEEMQTVMRRWAFAMAAHRKAPPSRGKVQTRR